MVGQESIGRRDPIRVRTHNSDGSGEAKPEAFVPPITLRTQVLAGCSHHAGVVEAPESVSGQVRPARAFVSYVLAEKNARKSIVWAERRIWIALRKDSTSFRDASSSGQALQAALFSH